LEDQIEHEVENTIEQEKLTLLIDIFKKWEKDIRKDSESPSQYIYDLLSKLKKSLPSNYRKLVSSYKKKIKKEEEAQSQLTLDTVLSEDDLVNLTIETIEQNLITERKLKKKKKQKDPHSSKPDTTTEAKTHREEPPPKTRLTKYYFTLKEDDSSEISLIGEDEEEEKEEYSEPGDYSNDDEPMIGEIIIDNPNETEYSGDERTGEKKEERERIEYSEGEEEKIDDDQVPLLKKKYSTSSTEDV